MFPKPKPCSARSDARSNESREVDRDAVRAKYSEIRKVYIETPLKDMQRKTPPSLSYTLKSASDIITAYKF